jgi:hypothetical protein
MDMDTHISMNIETNIYALTNTYTCMYKYIYMHVWIQHLVVYAVVSR